MRASSSMRPASTCWASIFMRRRKSRFMHGIEDDERDIGAHLLARTFAKAQARSRITAQSSSLSESIRRVHMMENIRRDASLGSAFRCACCLFHFGPSDSPGTGDSSTGALRILSSNAFCACEKSIREPNTVCNWLMSPATAERMSFATSSVLPLD